MISTEIKNIVESMIFASEEEITSKQIKEIVDKSGLRVSISEIEESVNSLNEEFKVNNKPFEILKIAGGFTFATKKEYGRFIGKLFEDKQRKKLSQSALETLSIIAYKQPITRSEIEFIRGVNVDYIVNSLLEKDLITINGRSETPGRPILYGTTKTFLKVLGLNAIEDLPKLKEINEILKNQEIEGITEADIELFNSVNNPDNIIGTETGHQLELLTNEEINNEEITEIDIYNEDDNDNEVDAYTEIEDLTDTNVTSETTAEYANLSNDTSDITSNELTEESNETLNEDVSNLSEMKSIDAITPEAEEDKFEVSVPENEIVTNENEAVTENEDITENDVENEPDNMSEKDFENTINSDQQNIKEFNKENLEPDNEDNI